MSVRTEVRMRELDTFGPTAGAAVTMTLISYRGRCHVGVKIDTAAVTDPEVPLDRVRDGFPEALPLGGAHAPVRLPLQKPREAPAA
jgi:hypothetical protein